MASTHEHRHPCKDCGKNEWRYLEDEYDSLGNGGSYEVCECTTCQKKVYSPLPD